VKWITWEQAGIDRIASGWLIRRNVDPDAEFLFIPRAEDPKTIDGIPFDIPGANLSHRRGKCTFLTILKEYGIHDPLMDKIGAIVNAADTVSDALPPPESAGVDLICRGLTKALGDDSEALEVGRILFDAIYHQLKEQDG
jgi:hypothetical protein